MDCKIDIPIASLLNSINMGVIIAGSDYGIIFINNNAEEILEKKLQEIIKSNYLSIFELFKISDDILPAPYSTDILKKNIDYTTPSKILKTILLYIERVESIYVISFRDITKEKKLIDEYFLVKKELIAKSVLDEYRFKELKACQDRMQIFRDYLPDGIVIIKKDFSIAESNLFLKNKLSGQGGIKCFQIFHRLDPCPGCPVSERRRDSPGVVGHEKTCEYITEEILPIDGGAEFFLIFKDSTHKVKLIKEIKAQQDLISEQKDLFVELSGLMQKMHRESDASIVGMKVLAAMLARLGGGKGFLLVEDLRKGTVWFRLSMGIDQAGVDLLTGLYLSADTRENQFIFSHSGLDDIAQGSWFQLPILAIDGRRLGILAYNLNRDKNSFDIDHQGLVNLYFEPFISYLQNKMFVKRLEEKVNIDGLTGLYNRNYFEKAFKEEFDKNAEHNIPFSVLVADMNGLKFVNDTYGHHAGDELIKATADVFRKVFRSGDVPARIGGDEFYILLTNTAYSQALCVMERLRAIFSGKKIYLSDGTAVPISFSFGLASSDKVHAERVIEIADQEMYLDKKKYYSNNPKYR